MKCHRCGFEISEDESLSYQGQTLCENRYIEVASQDRKCDTWESHLATHTRESAGMKGTEELTELQKKIHEFIKDKGKVTREEVKQNLSLSEADIDTRLTSLMHSELVKERGERGNIYLIPIG